MQLPHSQTASRQANLGHMAALLNVRVVAARIAGCCRHSPRVPSDSVHFVWSSNAQVSNVFRRPKILWSLSFSGPRHQPRLGRREPTSTHWVCLLNTASCILQERAPFHRSFGKMKNILTSVIGTPSERISFESASLRGHSGSIRACHTAWCTFLAPLLALRLADHRRTGNIESIYGTRR